MPTFPEFLVSTKDITEAVSKAVAAGRLRKLGSRIYTTHLKEDAERLVRRNVWTLAGLLFQDGIVADRTALERKPAADGSVFLIASSGGDVELPGLTIRPRRGPGPLPGDYPFRDGLKFSSLPRAFLENMKPTRARQGIRRTLTRQEMEEEVEALVRNSGVDGLNRLRDQVRELGASTGMEKEAADFQALCAAVLGTGEDKLVSPAAVARRSGEPFDGERVRRLDLLHDHLRGLSPPPRRALALEGDAAVNQAFFEAYFSNFIEGTEFEIDEAVAIVFEGEIPSDRPEDAHDVMGTFAVVSDPAEMSRTPSDPEEFIALLKARHARVMEGRPGKRPGKFKERRNRAGNSVFVEPEQTIGTLREGFRIYRRLDDPFHRAVFMMFLVSEVHPFDDGNGRVARIMMNAELAGAGQARIIVPIVFRSNYLEGLKALTQSDAPATLVRSLDFAQRYVAAVPWADFDVAAHVLRQTNGFVRPEDGDAAGVRLRIPAAYDLKEDDTSPDLPDRYGRSGR